MGKFDQYNIPLKGLKSDSETYEFTLGDDFFELLYGQGKKTLEGLDALCAFVSSSTKENAEKVKDIEMEADDLRRIIIDRLNNTFITPIDREDIFSLSRAIDDVMDYACTTVYEMQVYKVDADGHILAMTEMSVLWDQLKVKGFCELADGTKLTSAQIRRMACEADITCAERKVA